MEEAKEIVEAEEVVEEVAGDTVGAEEAEEVVEAEEATEEVKEEGTEE